MKIKTAVFGALVAVPVALWAAPKAMDFWLAQTQTDQSAAATAGKPTRRDAPMETTKDQANASRLLYNVLSESGDPYKSVPLDDARSRDIYKRYLEALDFNKIYLSADDLAKFPNLDTQLDDAIRSGNLQPAFDLYGVFKQRAIQRTRYARDLLKQDIFTFTGKDTFEFDREKAAWAPNQQALDQLWRQLVRYDWMRLELAGRKPDEIRKTLDKRYTNLGKTLNDTNGDDVVQSFLNSYANSVDPHTDYLNPRSAQAFNTQISQTLEGIGAVLQKQDDVVAIREVVAGGPASKSGMLKPGDRIVAVGQGAVGTGALPMEDVVGWRIDDVVQLIRGKKGTTVRLSVILAEASLDSQPKLVTLVRDKVKLEDGVAKSDIIEIPAAKGQAPQKVGVIKLPGFYQDFSARGRSQDYVSASRDVARLITEFKSKGVTGVVMDLRDNGGGSLDEAIKLTGLFIDQGPVVQVRDSANNVDVGVDRQPGALWTGPLAVLINRSSASASEIFAAAIQDYGRGLIVGDTSFGKGTVQNMQPLFPSFLNTQSDEDPYGSIKMTIAEFFRISGSSTQNKGVTPDLFLPTLVDHSKFGESSYDNALPWSKIPEAPHATLGGFGDILPALQSKHEARIRADREFQWLLQDVAYFKSERSKTSVVLNIAERRAERDRLEAQRKARQAERKKLGLPLDPLSDDSKDDGLSVNERNIASEAAKDKLLDKRPDPLLRETAQILSDAINLRARRVASK